MVGKIGKGKARIGKVMVNFTEYTKGWMWIAEVHIHIVASRPQQQAKNRKEGQDDKRQDQNPKLKYYRLYLHMHMYLPRYTNYELRMETLNTVEYMVWDKECSAEEAMAVIMGPKSEEYDRSRREAENVRLRREFAQFRKARLSRITRWPKPPNNGEASTPKSASQTSKTKNQPDDGKAAAESGGQDLEPLEEGEIIDDGKDDIGGCGAGGNEVQESFMINEEEMNNGNDISNFESQYDETLIEAILAGEDANGWKNGETAGNGIGLNVRGEESVVETALDVPVDEIYRQDTIEAETHMPPPPCGIQSAVGVAPPATPPRDIRPDAAPPATPPREFSANEQQESFGSLATVSPMTPPRNSATSSAEVNRPAPPKTPPRKKRTVPASIEVITLDDSD